MGARLVEYDMIKHSMLFVAILFLLDGRPTLSRLILDCKTMHFCGGP